MKYLKALITLILFSTLLQAQVGINNTSPNASLDISATNQANPSNTDGLLIPRVDSFPAIDPSAAQQGMMVYLTTTSGSNPPGFYYWDNNAGPAAWVSVVGGTVEKLNDLLDGKSDNDGSNNGSSVFLGFNSGLGDDSSDNRNVGVGFESIKTNTSGSLLTAIGYQSLLSNTTGWYNVGIGNRALYSNTTGYGNTAIGNVALYNNTTGAANNANGYMSMYANTTGRDNTANGYRSLSSNTTGLSNTAVGADALGQNTTGSNNTAIGERSIYYNKTGSNATAIGYGAMFNSNNTSVSFTNSNVALGFEALRGSITPASNTGNNNTALGYQTLLNNSSGIDNATNGYQSLYSNTTGSRNTAIGHQSLYNNTTGIYNTAIGYNSGYNNITGSSNVFIGHLSGGQETGSNKLYIENTNATSDNALIYGEFNTNILRTNGEFQIGNPTGTGYAFPTIDGTLNQVLSTNGSGQISFVDASAISDDWANIGPDIERQSGDVYIGNTNTTDNDLYISDRIIDWDSSLYYLDPDNISKVDEIEFDGGSALDPSIRFSDSDTGFYSPSNQTTAYSTNGSEVFRINNYGDMRIGSISNVTDYKLIVKSANNNVISLGAQNNTYRSSVKIDHVSDTGNGLDVNVTSTYSLAVRSAIKTYNALGNIRTHLAEYSSTRVYGVYNDIFSNGIQDIYGVYNFITSSGSGIHYGTQNRLLGTGSGTKYGSYNFIASTAGGTHYGVYSAVLKTGSYAGYFLGNLAIGTTGANTYTLPASRGTNGQVMQTDGSGNLNWVNTSAVGTDDQNLTSATLTGTSLAIAIENGIGATVDLASLQDGTGTDNQNLTSATLTGSSLAIAIENGTGTSVDLSPLQDADWYEAGGTAPNSINDNIYTAGKVGINTISPDTRLHLTHVNNGTTGGFKMQNATANYWRLYVSSGATGDFRFYSSVNSNALTAKINGVSGAYTAVSDRRLKKDFDELHFNWQEFMSLKPLTYRFKVQKDHKKYIGLVAQDVKEIYPELVSYTEDEDVYQLDYSATGIIAIKAVQELKKEVEILSQENKKLKNKLSKYEQLEARLSALENKAPSNLTDLAANK